MVITCICSFILFVVIWEASTQQSGFPPSVIPFIDQLISVILRMASVFAFLKIRRRVPVQIVEKIHVGQRLHFFKKYVNKQLFLGRLPVLGIILFGLSTCTFLGLTGRFPLTIRNELLTILSSARIDDMTYQVVDFFQKKDKLVIEVVTRMVN
jgi:hypothetical protein